jgi:hypothetical protein
MGCSKLKVEVSIKEIQQVNDKAESSESELDTIKFLKILINGDY